MTAESQTAASVTPFAGRYEFKGGYPTPETVQKAYDDADLNRAIQAYRFFYATVSGAATIKANQEVGIVPNKVFGMLDTEACRLHPEFGHALWPCPD